VGKNSGIALGNLIKALNLPLYVVGGRRGQSLGCVQPGINARTEQPLKNQSLAENVFLVTY
jgi:hypothetical protein